MQQAAYKYSSSWQEQVDPPSNLSTSKVKIITRQHNVHRKIMVKCGMFVFAYAVLLVFLCAKSASLGYEVENLNKDNCKIATSNQRLEYQIARQSSLARVEKIATSELGMQKVELQNSIAVQVESQPIKVASSQTPAANISQKPLYKIYTSLSHLAQNSL